MNINRREAYIRTQKGQLLVSAARTNQREGEEDTGIRTAGRGKETTGKTRPKQKKEKRRREKENIVLQGVIVTWVPV